MYSQKLWEHYHNPHNAGKPAHFHKASRKLNPICGDSLELFLSLGSDERIEQLHFVAKACPPVVALASMLCEWAAGREQGELAGLNEEEFRSWIGPLPPNKRHAIQLHLWAIRELVPEFANGLSNQT